MLARDWPHASGQTLPIRVMCVDAGYATQDVYGWVRQHPQAGWGPAGAAARQPHTAVAVKGRDQDTALLLSVSRADAGSRRRGLRVWSVGTPVAKGELYRWLKLEWPTEEAIADGASYPPGACHFPQYGEEYFKQLTAERLVTRIVKGFPRASWEKEPGRRNEALDCRVYARAAAAIYGIDRWSEAHWRELERSLGRQEAAVAAAGPSAEPQPARSPRPAARQLAPRPARGLAQPRQARIVVGYAEGRSDASNNSGRSMLTLLAQHPSGGGIHPHGELAILRPMNSIRPAVRHPAQIAQVVARKAGPRLPRCGESAGHRIVDLTRHPTGGTDQKTHIKRGIVEYERAVADEIEKRCHHLLERFSFLFQQIVGDAGDRGDLGRDLPLRLDQAGERVVQRRVAVHTDGGDLDGRAL